jgi:hypothetical protein
MAQQQTLFGMVDRLPRDERKDQIFDAVAANRTGLTARGIGARIGLRKTPHLLSMINEMMHEGYLKAEWQTMPNGMPVRVYFLTQEYRPDAS